jgi:hypothetical protein
LYGTNEEVLNKVDNKVQIKYLLDAYKTFPDKANFFIIPKTGNPNNSFFNKLAGNSELMAQHKSRQNRTGDPRQLAAQTGCF